MDDVEIMDEYNKMVETTNRFVEETAEKVLSELTQEEKEKILKYADEDERFMLHFGLGMRIRNQYIYKSKERLFGMADMISSDIIDRIIERLQENELQTEKAPVNIVDPKCLREMMLSNQMPKIPADWIKD